MLEISRKLSLIINISTKEVFYLMEYSACRLLTATIIHRAFETSKGWTNDFTLILRIIFT
jgi:hypothetical protein